MAKLTNMRLDPLLDLDRNHKITARQPVLKLIPGHGLEFNNLPNSFLKRQKKNGVWISKETYLLKDVSGKAMIMAIMGPNGAKKSNDAVPTFIQERFTLAPNTSHKQNAYGSSSGVISSLIAYLQYLCSSKFYFWITAYASLINANAYVILVSATIPVYITGYAVVIATTAFFFLKSLQTPGLLSGLLKDVKISKLHNMTLAAQNSNWKLIDKDALFTVDVYSIEDFCISLGILLAWGVLRRLFFYVVSRFYSKNERK